jgi:hypothetical protein
MSRYISFDGEHVGNMPEDDVVIFGDDSHSLVYDRNRTRKEDRGHYWPWNWEVGVA